MVNKSVSVRQTAVCLNQSFIKEGRIQVKKKYLTLLLAIALVFLGGILGAAPGPDGAWAGSPEALKRGVYT